MKVTVDARALAAAAREAKSIAAKGTSMPILESALLETGDDGLSIEATNMLDRVRRRIGGEGSAPARCCVLAADLATVTGSLFGEVTLGHDTETSELTIEHSRGKVRLPTRDPDDFPRVTDKGADRRETIDAAVLADAIRRVWPAASHDETRPHLAGVYLGDHEGKLRTAATNGHCMSAMPTDVGWADGFILPYHAVPALLRILDAHDGDVEVSPSAAYTRVDVPGVTLWTRMVDESFPPIDRVLPVSDAKTVRVNRAALIESAKRLRDIALQRVEGRVTARIILTFAPGELRMAADNSDRGSAHETLATDGEWEESVALESTYLAEHLAAGDGDDVELHFHGQLDPFELRFPAVEGMRVVIMPMRM